MEMQPAPRTVCGWVSLHGMLRITGQRTGAVAVEGVCRELRQGSAHSPPVAAGRYARHRGLAGVVSQGGRELDHGRGAGKDVMRCDVLRHDTMRS